MFLLFYKEVTNLYLQIKWVNLPSSFFFCFLILYLRNMSLIAFISLTTTFISTLSSRDVVEHNNPEEDKNRKWGLTGFMGPWSWAKRMSRAHPLWNSWWNKGPIWIGQIIGKILREHVKDRRLFTMNNLYTTFRIPRGRVLQGNNLGYKERRQNLTTIKSPNTSSHQGTHNLPLSSTLELWEYFWLNLRRVFGRLHTGAFCKVFLFSSFV